MTSYRVSKFKVTIGYILLLAILLSSLLFVHREMETLSAVDNQQNLRTDSLMALIREKDKNMLQMLRFLSAANDSLLSASEVKHIISERDSVVEQQRIQHRVHHRVITKRDSLLTPSKKKGFFKRLAEAFNPSRQDSAVLVNTSLEVATDTILEPVAPPDSLEQKLHTVAEEKRLERSKNFRRTSTRYQRLNRQLTARVDTLIRQYEKNMMLRARRDAAYQQEVRMRSARLLAGVAIGAVLLSFFFLTIIIRDISRGNRYRRELELANQRAKDLLVAREKLMLAITHDFKAPLGSIIGYTELLSRLTDDERQLFYLDNMKSSSEHLLKLVSDLLDFHRLDLNKVEVNRVSFNPSQLFEEIHISFEPLTAAKGLALKCRIAPELNDNYISDPLRIRQIVNNLLSNAVKFTQQGAVTLTVSYASSRLTIHVEDTGQGMESSDCERIFQEFTRLSGAQGEEGFGLGLSIVKKLVTLLEGSIEVQSTLGHGSCFTVVLPLYAVGKSARKSTDLMPNMQMKHSESNETNRLETFGTSFSAVSSSSLPSSAIRVLLIDDDKIQLTLTAAMLKQYQIDAVCCEQLDELIEQLRTSTFSVLLTDIQMPALNGFDLVKLLRASSIPQAKSIPIIAVTARSEIDMEVLHEHGFTGCLHKPFTVKELLQIVSEGRLTSSEPVAEQSSRKGIRFSALTAFSEDDEQAAYSIIQTFVEETQKSLERLEQAVAQQSTEEIAAVAHKLLPLFTLIDASESIAPMKFLESCRGEVPFSEEIRTTALQVIRIVSEVLTQAREYRVSMKRVQ